MITYDLSGLNSPAGAYSCRSGHKCPLDDEQLTTLIHIGVPFSEVNVFGWLWRSAVPSGGGGAVHFIVIFRKLGNRYMDKWSNENECLASPGGHRNGEAS